MFYFFLYLIFSVLLSFGMSVALVEKGDDWPIRKYRLLLKLFIHDHIHWKFAQVLDCTVCSSFWITLISDLIFMGLSLCFGAFYFFWPFSGFIALGFTWFVIQYLNKNDQDLPMIINNQD